MSKEYPSFAKPMLGVAIIDLMMLWYFDWAGWAWVAAAVLAVMVLMGWFKEALAVHREGEVQSPGSSRYSSPSDVSSVLENDDVTDGGQVLWQGQRQIRFAYQSSDTGDSDREVTVQRVVSKGRGNSSTYFKGYCHMRREPRTFRVDRIQGKVTDTSTGEMATFRQLFELSAR
ncbi:MULTISPECIES: WYL domain-containing protein [Pseudomonas]|uniref:WYL domain-containing protein n=1 Tax=Pseudomonas TaxID=286 RepID=UPI001AE2F4DE|nr:MULTISPECIES: WYL domain-containing protein [unclassified Pseudomonas]MBP2273724.1 hypothetical protein [Pseudomonas sp. BP6]MBP2287305.1 hypothetical protein [Pseudomonas sp. BP7]HDS1696299.1 WYL domain-containing protein [Pseudomonas putida]HDS1703344.1 WYL domain-containing protein [Pseudomonas putida]